MSAPQILAKIIDDTLVVADEFSWGTFDRRPIAWRILEIGPESVTAVSVATVAERVFDEESRAWNCSALRSWLNEEFMKDCLGEEAVQHLLSSPESEDLVWIPSIREAQSLFAQDSNRVAEGDNRNWWLRDAGGAEGFQAYVHNNGWINEYGAEAASNYAAVRPAITLNAGALELILTEDQEDVVHIGDIPTAHSIALASEFGEELLLEAMDEENIFMLEDFVSWFGVHESWETTMVDAIAELAESGDSLEATRLLEMCSGIEFLGSALAAAMSNGHVAMAGTLLRAGAKLDGSTSRAKVMCDTPELRRARKKNYQKEADLCRGIVTSENGYYSISALVRQGLIKGKNFHALLRAAGKNEVTQELFEWMLCPDHKPLPRMGAFLAKNRICVVDHPQSNCLPVSQWALTMLWYPKLAQDDPETLRAMATSIADAELEDRRELICFLAQANHMDEIQRILAGKKVFSPKDIAAAIDAASNAGNNKIARYLRDFLRSIGAGKLANQD